MIREEINLSDKELEILKHSLGLKSNHVKKYYGYRNRFCGNASSDKAIASLVEKGLLIGEKPQANLGGSTMYKVTRKGCELLGMDEEQIRNVLRN